MKNLLYLKRYVKMHPNNRMGWYLLGKEYESDGQMGKANYCYNRAGDIYEAFEHSKIPADVLKDYEAKVMEMAQERERKIRNWRSALFALVLLLLILMRSVDAPAADDDLIAAETDSALTQSGGNPDKDHSIQEEPATYHAPLSFTAAVHSAGSSSAGKALDIYMAQQSNETQPQTAVVLGMQQSEKWLLWKHVLPALYTMTAGENAGQVNIQSYDPKACHCKPDELDSHTSEASAWMNQQEQLAVMQTAIANYHTAQSRLPSALGTLDQAFPGNWLSGRTDLMGNTFDTLQKYPLTFQQSNLPIEGFSGKAQKLFAGTLGNQPYFTKPLEVIVDKKKHRLAIASGSILLRNYEVGLGGDRTPEGVYNISIKVMNPNGKSNGEFGSRGMQLSDTNYAIHGTNEPDSIGGDESLGCIRMNQADVEELFDMIPKGTKVTVTSDVLPDDVFTPEQRFTTNKTQNQTDSIRTYHWLN